MGNFGFVGSRAPAPAFVRLFSGLAVVGLLACGTQGLEPSGSLVPNGSTTPAEVDNAAPATTPVANGNATSPGAVAPVVSSNGNGNVPAATPPASSAGSTDPAASQAVAGDGFSLRSVTAPTLCLESSSATPAAGDSLRLAPCANKPAQAFAWYKGGFALGRKYCLTSTGSVGGKITLSTCISGAAQVWELSGSTGNLAHTIASTNVTGQTLGSSNGSVTGNIVTVAKNSANAIKLQVAPLPGTDGYRLHASPAYGVDYCLADDNGVLATQSCAQAVVGQQVWSFSNNQLRAATGRCLLGDVSSKAVRIGSCLDAPPASQQWYVMDYFISMMTPSDTLNESTSLVLDIDGSRNVRLKNLNPALNPNFALGAPTGFF